METNEVNQTKTDGPSVDYSPPTVAKQRLPRRRVLASLSIPLCLAAWMLNATQPEALSWLMIFPRWTWLLSGLALLIVGFVKSQWKWSLALALLWLCYTGFNVEESHSLLRSAFVRPQPVLRGLASLRVVTFNCGSDGNGAVHEAFQQRPDLILFQESIQRKSIEEIAARYWPEDAAVIWASDTTIVAHGRLTLRQQSKTGTWVWATWHRADEDIEVVCLRLSPVPLRFDCWNRDCWRSLTELRETHRTEIAEITAALGTLSVDRRCIIGGDFNSPAHDASLRELTGAYQDAFDEAGFGWGNTIVNGCPVHRIDQLWINQSFSPLRVQAIHSRHSDHTLVMADLVAK